MITLQLALVCITVLLAIVLLTRSLLEREARRAQTQRETAMHERAAAAPVSELATAVQALTAAAAALDRAAETPGPSRIGHRLTVHTKQPDDQTFFGVLTAEYSDRLSLEDAELVTGAGKHPLPGRQDIEKRDVSWIDVHGQVTIPTVLLEPVSDA